MRVANDEAGEHLPVDGFVTNATANRDVFCQRGWLKEYSLLLVP